MVPGKNGIAVGNQQFTVRNLTVNNAVVGEYSVCSLPTVLLTSYKGIAAPWNWGMDLDTVFSMTCLRLW